MQALRKCCLLAVAAIVSACGGSNGQQAPAGADAGYGQYVLKLAGNPVQTLHPGEKRTLQVILAQDQIGAVPNADIQFGFQDGDPAKAALDTTALKTDADGAATITLTAGTATPNFKLVATAPGFPQAGSVAFSVQVVPVRRLLQIVGSPQIVVAQGGDSARVTLYTSSSIGLKVREIDKDTGSPIAGDTLSFSLPTTSATTFSGASARAATAVTNAGGEATVFAISSANPETNIVVTAQTGSSGALGSVSFSVNVNASSQGQSCTSSQQCPAGEVCVSGHCQTETGGSTCGSGTDNPCPFGYVCNNGVCQPPQQLGCDPTNPNSCPSGQYCKCSNPSDPSTCGCIDSCPVQCPQGQVCNPTTHTCDPTPPASPDVTGVWYTRHSYDISKALPTAVKDIFLGLRYIDQAIVGKLNLPPWLSWLNPLISKILKQYIPPWLQTIIRIGDDIGTILSMLRAEGAMRLTPGVDVTHVKGSEVWTSLVFYWLPLCGDNIGGDPAVPPACARFDVATTDSDNPGEPAACKGQSIPTISVQVGPITGAVAGSGTGADPWRVKIDQRQIKLQMGKVVLIVVNELLSLTTPWHCIDEATDCSNGPCIVDCPGLGNWVDGWAPGFGTTVEGICDTVVTAAGQEVSTLLNTITFNTDALDFNGGAVISKVGADNTVCSSRSSCAGQLGHADYDYKLQKDTSHRDGAWSGSFFFKVIKDMPGAWEAERQQFAPQQ